MLQQLHNDKSAQHIAEQSHAQRKGTDRQLHNIDGRYDCDRLGKALEPALDPVLANACYLHQNDGHQRHGGGNIQILGGGLHACHGKHIGYSQKHHHRGKVRHIALALMTHDSPHDILQ